MTYKVPSRVAYVALITGTQVPEDLEREEVYVRPLPGGPTLVLTGVGALIWTLAADGVPDVADSVAEMVGEPVDIIRAEVEDYLDLIVAQGLLQWVGGLHSSVRSHT